MTGPVLSGLTKNECICKETDTKYSVAEGKYIECKVFGMVFLLEAE